MKLCLPRAERDRLQRNNRSTRQELQQIDKMAGLADDPAAANCRVLGPVIRRNRAGIHGHDEALGFRYAGQKRLDLLYLRRKAAIESHHQERGRPLGSQRLVHRFDFSEFLPAECQRFFDKHMFTGLQRITDKLPMAVMPGCDDDGVDLGIG